MRKGILQIVVLVFILSCSRAGFTEAPKLNVVTTIFPPYDFTREIAGDCVNLKMLLPPGAESHSYEPTPRDIIMIQDCDVFIYSGGQADVWIERILASIDGDGIALLPMIELVDAVEEAIVEGMEEEYADEEEEDGGEIELDEHVWTSPQNAKLIAQRIADTLSALDPSRAEIFRNNMAIFAAALDDLDVQFRQVIDAAARTTVVFGDRFPFRYFADAYGLEYYAAFPGCATETEASAATIRFLIDKVRDEGIPVVFEIELSNGKIADAVAESAGAKKLSMHSVHNLTKDDFDAGLGYLSLMRRNAEVLKEALN
ncbi:MAG: metal ABC transporter substrate-binding protein [Clostridia bacterium]|nr:metal ABC transporter substrate-binding protein [Clostridia bacterium]